MIPNTTNRDRVPKLGRPLPRKSRDRGFHRLPSAALHSFQSTFQHEVAADWCIWRRFVFFLFYPSQRGKPTNHERQVGLQVLRLAIADPTVDSITILSRRSMPTYVPISPKASVIILEDFLHYPPETLPSLASHDACIWALGGSSKGHTEESYAMFTVDYVKVAVEALKEGGVVKGRDENNPFRFVFISGQWANPEETSRFMFARVKV
jgi:hypothetical protein